MPTIDLGHKKKRDKTLNKKRQQAIYQDRRWKDLRALKFRNNPVCEDCEAEGRVSVTKEVHHEYPVELYPELAFEYDYLVSVCVEHHKKRDQALRAKYKY